MPNEEKQASTLLIKRDEMVLLKNSEEAKDSRVYGSLFAAIERYDKLSRIEMDKDSNFDKMAKISIIKHKNELLKKISSNEWYAISCCEEATKEIRCQLCNTKNKFIFYIKNRINGIELHVGSECIKKFPGIEDVKSVRKSFEQLKNEKEKEIRRAEFEKNELKEPDFLKQAETAFESIDAVLPNREYVKLKGILYDMNFAKTEYIKNGGDITNTIIRYDSLKILFKEEWKKVRGWYNKNKNRELFCCKRDGEWLKEINGDLWEEVSMNGGFFTQHVLSSMYSQEFCQRNIKNFSNRIQSPSIRLIKAEGKRLFFEFKNSDYIYPIVFSVDSKWYMEKIGSLCLTEKIYFYGKKELNKVRIEVTQANLNAIYNRIKGCLNSIGLDIYIDEDTRDFYYVRLPETKISKSGKHEITVEKGYSSFSGSFLYEIFQKLIFAEDKEIEGKFQIIKNNINAKNSWISEKARKQYEGLAATMRERF